MEKESYEKLLEVRATNKDNLTAFDRVHKLWDDHEKLLSLSKEAESLLSEIVSRHIGDLLPRENFWRECGAVAEQLRTIIVTTDK